VEGPAIDLDDEAVVAPQEVDFVTFDADVRLGLWQAGFADQVEGDALEVGAGEVRPAFDPPSSMLPFLGGAGNG